MTRTRRAVWLLASSVLVLACRAPSTSKPAHVAATSGRDHDAASMPAQEAAVPPPPPPLSPEEVPRVQAGPRPLAELAAFYDALDSVRTGGRTTPLRVLWMGDSHTSADFMTSRVRARLQGLAGDAGPGFVRLGLDAYRHEAASFEVTGRFRQEPVLPAQRTRVKDGVFGYGGIRTVPLAGARVRVTVKAGEAGSPRLGDGARLRFRLAYRLPEGAAIDVRVGQEERRVSASDAGADPARLASLEIEGAPSDSFELAHYSGSPEIFGLFVESSTPGVVLDTVGIDGARAATPLAWEPEQFVSAVRERAPSLLVLAYGTNEIFDKTRSDQYTEHVVTLIDRVRAGAGPIPCWVVGPMDAPGPGGGSRPRVAEVTSAEQKAAHERGCAFTSAQAVMGGEGSFAAWTAAKPQLARTDGIHLTIAGYRRLGDLLADQLLPLADVAPAPELDVPSAAPVAASGRR